MDWTCCPISFDPKQPHLPLIEIRDQFSIVLAPALGHDLKVDTKTGLWSPPPEWQEHLTGPDSTLAKTTELGQKFSSYLINACIISPALQLGSWPSTSAHHQYIKMIKRRFMPERPEFHWGTVEEVEWQIL